MTCSWKERKVEKREVGKFLFQNSENIAEVGKFKIKCDMYISDSNNHFPTSFLLSNFNVSQRISDTLSAQYFEPCRAVPIRFRTQEVRFISFSGISEGGECKLR